IGSVSTGQTYTLTADVQEQCQQDEAAWGIPTSTPCQLAGIEIGTEGFQFQTLDVDWIAVALSTTSPPPLSASINFTPSAPVAGQGVSFTGSAIGGTAPYTYAWTFGDGGTASGSTVSHAYSTPGSYSVQLIVADNSAASASTTQTVTVAPQPPSPVQASFTVSPTSILVGQAVTFTGTATGGTQPYSYSWDFGDGATGSGAIAAYAYSTSGSFTVTLTVADSASQTGSASKSVPVSPSSIPDFTANASPTTVSVQAGNSASTQVQLSSLTGFAGTVLLTVTSSPTGPSPVLTQPSLSLTSGGSAATTLTISTTTSTTAMNYDVRVVAVGGSTSHTIHVTLRVTAIPPPPDIDISTSQSTLLLNAGATTNSIITLQTGTYGLTVYAASGSLQRSTSLTVMVTINSPPKVTVPAPTSGLAGFSIQFVVNATDPDQGQTITFSATGLPSGASFDPATGAFSWTPLPSQAGTYTMTFTATDDGNPPMSNSNSVTVTVEGTGTPPPPTQNQGTCLLCQITQTTKTNTWVLVTGILAGFMLTMTAIYLRARGRLQEVRRMRRLTRYS
ncbi:PKD domain-containing protein, partial [Candidatus Bathyarchaeota archaeon]